MALLRPSADIMSLRSQMDQLFQEMMEDFGMPIRQREGRMARSREQDWLPAIELSEKNNEYVVRAQVPGIEPENINVDVTGDTLIISGETRHEHQDESENVRHCEFRYGSFYRQIPLPTPVREQDGKAEFNNGILEVHLPKKEESQRKRIDVKTRNGGGRQR